jgi:hypothetical protein
MEAIDGFFFFFLALWGALDCVTTLEHCIWYNFKTTKYFEAT